MICHITVYPLTCSQDDILAVQHEDMFRNCFCGDVLHRGECPYYALQYFRKIIFTLTLRQKIKKYWKREYVIIILLVIT